jgi:uncharacterized protein (TIGR02996 family)
VGDREALYRAVVESPADDAPRLVFADWLEEHGEPERAEFIRVQIELAKRTWQDSGFHKLHARAERLARGKKLLWKQYLPELRGVVWDTFTRGFVSSARFRSLYWFHVRIKQVITAAPVHRIWLRPRFRVTTLNAIAESRFTGRLTELILAGHGIEDNVLADLAHAANLGSLGYLHLENNAITSDGLRALAESQAFPALRRLDVSANPLGPSAVDVILESTWMRGLEELVIDRARLDNKGAEALRNHFGERVVFPLYR